MKSVGHATRVHFSTLFVVVSLFPAATVAANGPLSEVSTSDLASLLTGEHILVPAGGNFRFTGFLLDGMPAGTAIPDLSHVFLSATESGLDSSILWQIDEGSRILRAGEHYDLAIQFRTQSILPSTRLSSSTLDIAGATIGTQGDAIANLNMELFDGTNLIGSLLTTESATSQQLIDMQQVSGPSEWTVRVHVLANGGNGSAAIVLTDFTTSFGVEVVPEPGAGAIACIGAVWLILLRRFGRRGAVVGN